MIPLQYIEVCVEIHPVDDKYFKSYQSHMFFTVKHYSHKVLANIMRNIQQIYIEDEDWHCKEIDFIDLRNKLNEFEIYQLLPVERYLFDLEED